MDKIDYKKTDKLFYAVSKEPLLVCVPKWKFIAVSGRGNPNDQDGEYQKAVGVLYALSYTVKMLPKQGESVKGYFDYTVPPLEGFWWMEGINGVDYSNKSKFCWLSVIRQPGFVTEDIFALAQKIVSKKKKDIDFSKAELIEFEEGLCVQCGHTGSFDNEPETIKKMELFMEGSNLISDISETRRHHEIYMSDPRKAGVSKNKCILRLPVKKA